MSAYAWYFTHYLAPLAGLFVFSIIFGFCVARVNRLMLEWLRKDA